MSALACGLWHPPSGWGLTATMSAYVGTSTHTECRTKQHMMRAAALDCCDGLLRTRPLTLQVIQLGLLLYFVMSPVDYPGGRVDPIRA